VNPIGGALTILGRVLLTLAFVAGSVAAGRWLWIYYQVDPWTRDGRIRVDVASVAPDVSGLVTEVDVVDNMPVHAGQPLFVIDRRRFDLALQQAKASLQAAEAGLQQAEAGVQVQMTLLAQARREDARNRKLGSLVSAETVEQGAARVAQLEAALAQANATRNTAALNLDRTAVVAPVDGIAADVQLRPGDYLTAGHAAFGIADASSLHIDGYFEETKLERIHVGDGVTVELMGSGEHVEGHVESIAPAIEDRERTPSGDLLANINPTFNWVRLAQRIPVRVHIDRVPSDLRLIAGRTATVIIHPGSTLADMGVRTRPW